MLNEETEPEAGFTLVELVMAMMILMIVLALFFNMLVSLTKTEQRAQALVSNEQDVRFELTQLAREVRAANPLVVLPTTDQYSNQITLILGPTGGTQEVVRWNYDTDPDSPTYLRLAREVMTDSSFSATVVSRSWFLTRVRNFEIGKPIFTYHDAENQDMVADGDYTNSDIANCAIRVHIELTADSNPGPIPFTETQDVELRNRLPGGTGCLLK